MIELIILFLLFELKSKRKPVSPSIISSLNPLWFDATTGTIISYDYYPMYNKDWSLNPKPEPRGGYKPRKVLNKMPCDNNLYFLYRPGGGNPVTSVMNNETNNRIIGRFNPTSVYPNSNKDANEATKKFWFMTRQNKTVNRSNSKNDKVNF